ncbi:hypothetical protein M9Y10_010161 [Tritrichomonas musculus]|uniref:DUF3447 domain-containing protein n=1 Tax=Tritrichomonas musculus TaxID=1915356 RepID=A0ABR2IQF2_9EUKA
MNEQVQQYFDRMYNVEENLLVYVGECNQDINTFFNYLDEQEITENKSKLKSFLYLIVQLSNNYHRTSDLYTKIDQILAHLKASIQKHFQNSEIFHIFNSNKRVLFFLVQQKILTIDQGIVDCFIQPKFLKKSYIEYFFPEVEPFLQESFKNKVKQSDKDSLDLFNEKRQIGENDSNICSLIRNDQLDDFIAYLEKNNISLSSVIGSSIYETNQLLLNKEEKVSLIEYSAYFGAQQIFVYLHKQNVDMTSDIWPYVIHGKSADLIHLLEENHIQTKSNSYQYLIVEAIKCHHNDIANYFKTNFCQKEYLYNRYLLKKHFKYYNFIFKIYSRDIIYNSVRSDLFYYLCKYDYDFVVEALLSLKEVNVNKQYKIYKPNRKQKDMVLSMAIKNGDINKIPKEKERERFYIRRHKEEPENLEYKDANNYYIYNYDLEIITPLSVAARKGNIDIIKLLV